MKKNRIKLNENALRSIIRKSLKRIYESEDYFSPEDYTNAGKYGDSRIDNYRGGSLGDDYFDDSEYGDNEDFSNLGIKKPFGHKDEHIGDMTECGGFNECGSLYEKHLNESISRNLKKILKNYK